MVRRYTRRSYRRNYYRSASQKYQFVPFSVTQNFPSSNVGMRQCIVPSSTVSGIRKVKNFNLNFVTSSEWPLLYAVVYIPDGANPDTLVPNINSGTSPNNFVELFAANQWVVQCGSISQGAQNRSYTRLARNLNNGDSVWLFVWRVNIDDTTEISVNTTGSYAIKYN